MSTVHEFQTPRNLFEKLVRDGDKLDMEVNGDNMFNFIATARHLCQWLKKSPSYYSEGVKRFVERVDDSDYIKRCTEMLTHNANFSIEVDQHNNTHVLKVGEQVFDALEFKRSVTNLYGSYFQVHGPGS